MTTPAPFQIDVDQLGRHAGTVGGLAGQLSTVANGVPGGLTGDALGIFVQFLTAGLTEAVTKTQSAMTNAASKMDSMSRGLAETANRYQGTDNGNATRLTGAGADA